MNYENVSAVPSRLERKPPNPMGVGGWGGGARNKREEKKPRVQGVSFSLV